MNHINYQLTLLGTLGLLALGTQALALPGCMTAAQKNGLNVGTSPDYPPYESLDSNNQIVGFDADLIQAIGKKLGVKINMVDQNFDSLIPALVARKVEVVAAGMVVTEERKKVVDFTLPYNNSASVIMVRKEDLKLNSAARLNGKSVGAQLGTTQEKVAQGIKGATVKSFNLYTDAAMALQTKQIDALVVDNTVAQSFVKTYPALRITGQLSKTANAFAVRKDCADVSNRMNAAIIQMRKSGEMSALTKKWFK